MKRLVLLSVLAALCGCATVRKYDLRVKVNPDVGRDLFVSGLVMGSTEAGYKTIRGTIHNDYGYDKPVEWRVVWLDENGVELEELASGWNKIVAPARGEAQIRGASTRPEARDYRFYLRKLREP